MATVLVVDDEEDIRELVRINLEIDGHQVLTARDGTEALDAVRREPPDVVLLDVMMPGVDGWEVLARLKAEADRELSDIPVLMLTARTDDLDQIRGGIEGAIRYITKPFSLSHLRQEVSRALEGEPEPVKRRQAQQRALARLARIEKGEPLAEEAEAPRPRLTRLERAPEGQVPVVRPPRPAMPQLASLSPKQRELLGVVASTATVRAAAEQLGVSRSNVYASLRRIARKLEIRSVPELVTLARQGELLPDDEG